MCNGARCEIVDCPCKRPAKSTPHKWHKEIKAWADGAQIQFLSKWNAGNYDPLWCDCTNMPQWNNETEEYRIKKEPVIEVKYFERVTYRDGSFYKVFYKEFTPDLEKWDLKITYQDGKAIKAEVAE